MGKVKHTTFDWNGHPVKIADWSKLSHKEWEQWRGSLNMIGGSDVSTICGYNDYKDPLILFYEKLGLKQSKFYPNELTAGGHADEPGILARLESWDGADWVEHFYSEKKFRKVTPYRWTFFSDDMPWLAFNMDGVISDDKMFPDKGLGVAEFKKIRGQYCDKFKGGVPPKYTPQVVAGMEATGSYYGIIALLRDGVELIVRPFDRSMEKYQWWADLVHLSCGLFASALDEGRAIVEKHGGVVSDGLLDELLDVEAKYGDVLYVSSDERLGSWYSEIHNMRQERGTAEPDSELTELVAMRERVAEDISELSEKKNLLDNQIKDWMRKRKAILAEDGKVRVGFRKNLVTKVKDESIFFGA